MEFNDFLTQAQGLPLISTRLLSAGDGSASSLKVQISRWVKSGKLIQLKRGLYVLPEPYRKISPSEFYIANMLNAPSYISLEKALEYHGIIPEAVSVCTSVTTKRAGTIKTPLGFFDYRHIGPSRFWGYRAVKVRTETCFIATPEKALLDFFYLKHVKVTDDYLNEMRLQNLQNIKMTTLDEYAKRVKKKKFQRDIETLKTYLAKKKKRIKRL